MCVSGDRESLSTAGTFLWLRHTQLAFALERSRPIIVLGSFSCAQYLTFAKTLPGKMQLPFFSSFAAVTLKQKADENRALGHR